MRIDEDSLRCRRAEVRNVALLNTSRGSSPSLPGFVVSRPIEQAGSNTDDSEAHRPSPLRIHAEYQLEVTPLPS